MTRKKSIGPKILGFMAFFEPSIYNLLMTNRVLKQSFFSRPTVEVAKDLLGKYLVRRYRIRGRFAIKSNSRKFAYESYMITEVEIYDGFNDKGSHASRGQTKRNFPMFGSAGYWYVYFTYGMHWMLNIVTREKGYPGAILVRGLEGINGPARLTKKLKINGDLNNSPASQKTGLWVEDSGIKINQKSIKRSPRVGIAYAGPYWSKRLLRFWI
jgi:DNA-3-methyladenine glycosylase